MSARQRKVSELKYSVPSQKQLRVQVRQRRNLRRQNYLRWGAVRYSVVRSVLWHDAGLRVSARVRNHGLRRVSNGILRRVLRTRLDGERAADRRRDSLQ